MFKEFRQFAMRGNVVDMAVGIIIGGAFGTIVKSLVDDVIMPPIGLMLGNVDFTNLFVVLKQGTKAAGPYTNLVEAHAAGAVTLNYGQFINNIVSFIIVAFAVFMLVRTMNRLQERLEHHADPEATTKECPYCLSVINIKATRCPNCTSELDAPTAPANKNKKPR
jgi:large conductance mechanosensitive channel